MTPNSSLSIVGATQNIRQGPGAQFVTVPTSVAPPNPPLNVPVIINKESEPLAVQAGSIEAVRTIQPIQGEKVFKLVLSEEELRYTSLGAVKVEAVMLMVKQWNSAFLESVTEGDHTVFRSKREAGVLLDARMVSDRLAELSIIGSAARILARRAFGSSLKEVLEINVRSENKVYVSRVQKRINHFVWIAHDLLREMVVSIHPELEEVLSVFPRTGLPPRVKEYSVPLPIQKSVLEPFIFDEEKGGQFTIITMFTAEITGIPLLEIRKVAQESGLISRMILEDTLTETVTVKGWVEPITSATQPNYEILILFFLALKRVFGDRIHYVQLQPSAFTPKIIKTSLWATPEVVAALINGGFLNPNGVRQSQGVKIGDYQLNRYPLSQTGISSVVATFGDAVIQSEFIVRPFNKVEVTFGDPAYADLLIDIFDQNLGLFNVLQRSLTSMVFEAAGPDPYLSIMKVYFTIKYLKGTILVSEFNPQKPKLGPDALDEISHLTEFGGNKATVQIIVIEKTAGKPEGYLIGDARAVDALLGPLPEVIRRDVVLQQISSNVLGRKVGPKAYAYIAFLLS